MNDVPKHVIEAVNCMLRPYGVNFSELVNRPGTPETGRYMTAKQASAYCGLSQNRFFCTE